LAPRRKYRREKRIIGHIYKEGGNTVGPVTLKLNPIIRVQGVK
jgi:hypothetical protein